MYSLRFATSTIAASLYILLCDIIILNEKNVHRPSIVKYINVQKKKIYIYIAKTNNNTICSLYCCVFDVQETAL